MNTPQLNVSKILLPTVNDLRGDITFIESKNHIPFDIARVYFLYNVPAGSGRGGHAHYELEQVIFALSGSFRLKIDNGKTRSNYWLSDPREGLLMSRMLWREIDSFSHGAVCMVLASKHFDEGDYIRDYEQFLRLAAVQ